MKIVFNTHYPNAAASIFYQSGFCKLKEDLSINDWNNYQNADIALFMTYPKDLLALEEAKKKFPSLKTGLIDPRNSKIIKYLDYIDFFIVDSLEMYDYFVGYGKPIHIYTEYPDIPVQKKKHQKKDKIIIAYHGNKVHLAGMKNNMAPALDLLSEKYQLEFWAIYNINKDRPLEFGLPERIKTRHIQWTKDVYQNILNQSDIGIAPSLMPVKNIKKLKRKARIFKRFFGEVDEDYLIRFKMPSNPGRMIVFARLGIPIVADFYPSALQLIQHGEDGFLAYDSRACYIALEKLIENADLRQQFADNMQSKVNKRFNFDIQNEKLICFVKNSILKNYRVNPIRICASQDYSSYLMRHAALDYFKSKLYYLKKYFIK